MLDIFIGVLFFVAALWLVFYLNKSLQLTMSRGEIGLAFSFRVLSGIALTLIYTYHYPDRSLADTFRYFDDSYYLHQMLWENPKNYFLVMLGVKSEMRDLPLLENMNNWFTALRSPLYNDNRTVIRINTIMRWFSFGSYYVHLCLFALMGFVGQMYIFKAFKKYFVSTKFLLFGVVFFIPSVVFWTSGILKEGPLFLAFGYLLFIMEKGMREGIGKKEWWKVLLLFAFLFQMKFYVGLMLIPVFTLHWLLQKKTNLNKWLVILLNYSAYFAAAIVWHFIRFKWSLFTVFKWKKKDFEGLAKSMNAKSLISTYDLEDNAWSFVVNIPQGLFNALFRPFIWEAYTPFIMLNAIENLLFFAFMLLCFYFRKRTGVSNVSLYFLVYAVSLLTVVGMVTPIMGSLVRYKIPALPFLLMFFISMMDVEKVKRTIKKRNKNEV